MPQPRQPDGDKDSSEERFENLDGDTVLVGVAGLPGGVGLPGVAGLPEGVASAAKAIYTSCQFSSFIPHDFNILPPLLTIYTI